MPDRIPNVLSIAGIDPSGGAGTYADLKSIAANGGYGMGAVTAVTVQNTVGVRGVHVPPATVLTAQLDAISDDIRIDAVKTGMLADADVIAAIEAWLDRARPPVLVVDPVMIATSGDRLLDAAAERALRQLVTRADVVTPNVPELVTPDGEITEFSGARVDTRNTHGTGCSLASALATRYARTGDWDVALRQARDWLATALAHADELDVGHGHGPVHHFA